MKRHTTTKCGGAPSASSRFERKILSLIDQCCRFDQLAESLKPWAKKWSTTTMERWLELPNLPTRQREMVLTALAIKATERSGALLAGYEPGGESEEHRLFHRVCIIEWEQRFPPPTSPDAAA